MRLSLPSSLARASLRKRLWLGAAAVAIFIGTIAIGYVLTPKPPNAHATVGYDFIAFYTAGHFVLDGRTRELYDLRAVAAYQHDLAHQNGADLGTAVGPWWNPPFYAWLFVPVAKLPFPLAMKVWIAINLLCFVGAVTLLCQFLSTKKGISTFSLPPDRGSKNVLIPFIWGRNWGLVGVLLVLSVPFIHAISHAQNTCMSLLLLTATVWLWREQRAFAAGIIGGLLLYKPQLGAVVATVLAIDLGWVAFAGIAITGAVLLAASLALPGMVRGFVHQMPANLHFVQDQVKYLWERHVTFKAFWRLLIQGTAVGEPVLAVRLLSTLCSTIVGAGLLWAIVRFKRKHAITNVTDAIDAEDKAARRDRIIAATIASTPLLMPFYFDYDQLLLAVPAVLLAADVIRRGSANLPRAERWLLRVWPAHYLWLMLNPDFALITRINLTVPLLAIISTLMIARALRRGEAMTIARNDPLVEMAIAA